MITYLLVGRYYFDRASLIISNGPQPVLCSKTKSKFYAGLHGTAASAVWLTSLIAVLTMDKTNDDFVRCKQKYENIEEIVNFSKFLLDSFVLHISR